MPFNDYVRAYRVIRSVLESFTDPHDRCVVFAIAGAKILREHYGVNATVCVGGAAYVLGPERTDVLTYAHAEDGTFVADGTAFHCWVHAEDHFIDFMAPLFPEILRREGTPARSAPRMFQRPCSEARAFEDLEEPGDFSYRLLHPHRAGAVLARALPPPEHGDLWETIARWFVPCPRKIRRAVELVHRGSGRRVLVPLSGAPVDGAL